MIDLRILVSSLHFSPVFRSHCVAFGRQCEKAGHEVMYLLSSRYRRGLPSDISKKTIFAGESKSIGTAIKDGVNQEIDLLVIKSGLDGVMSIALTASYGIGVVFSIIPILLYQGSITILALLLGSELSSTVQLMIYAIGGILILGLGIRILEIKELPVGNMIPSILLVIPFTAIIEFLTNLN